MNTLFLNLRESKNERTKPTSRITNTYPKIPYSAKKYKKVFVFAFAPGKPKKSSPTYMLIDFDVGTSKPEIQEKASLLINPK